MIVFKVNPSRLYILKEENTRKKEKQAKLAAAKAADESLSDSENIEVSTDEGKAESSENNIDEN